MQRRIFTLAALALACVAVLALLASAGVAQQQPLSVTKTDSPDPVEVGQTLTYTLSVQAGATLREVTLTDTLPAGVTFLSASAGCTIAGTQVMCPIGSMSSGQTQTRTISVRTDTPGTVTNSATASGQLATGGATSGQDSEPTTIEAPRPTEADVSVVKTVDPSEPAFVGDELIYTLTVKNKGPLAATGVTLVDTLPTAVALTSASPSQGSCTTEPAKVTCALGSIAPGSDATVTITVVIASAGTLVNSASVSATQPDPVAADNQSIAATQAAILPEPQPHAFACHDYGTNAGEAPVGNLLPNRLCSLPGADRVLGAGGNDYLYGGNGDDTIVGGPGANIMLGGLGDDTLDACNHRADQVIGGAGFDRAYAESKDLVKSVELVFPCTRYQGGV